MTTTQHVAAQGVIKTYREAGRRHEVLRGIEFTVAPGECVALVGRSGSGKSTLLHLMAGIDTPDAGRLLIDDRDICGLSERERTLFRRHHIGLVFQFFNLVSTLTVAENLLLPLELCDVAGPQARKRVHDLLAQVGLAERAASHPEELSGGEQQRVAIARALIHGPGLLLADEPTGNLDDETGATVLALLRDLIRERGLTMMIATHSAEVAAFADRVLSLHDGVVRPGQ
ncbi:MAG: ABC transporter ATP-binding protein [Gammaproteobacteria bacterium]|jgi:putative ABC transport system ATP-binding protein